MTSVVFVQPFLSDIDTLVRDMTIHWTGKHIVINFQYPQDQSMVYLYTDMYHQKNQLNAGTCMHIHRIH